MNRDGLLAIALIVLPQIIMLATVGRAIERAQEIERTRARKTTTRNGDKK